MPEPISEKLTIPEFVGAGVNIIQVTDLDGRLLFVPYIKDLADATHPAESITHQGQFLHDNQNYPQPHFVDIKSLTANQRARLSTFLSSSLPILFAVHLALNTDEPIDSFQNLDQDCVCLSLVGMSQVGKSTLAKKLADHYQAPVIDMELFDPERPDKHSTIRQAIDSGIKQLKESPSSLVILDANGMGDWDDRAINAFDFVSRAAEIAITVSPKKGVSSLTDYLIDQAKLKPFLYPVIKSIGIKGSLPTATSRYVLINPQPNNYINPEEFISLLENFRLEGLPNISTIDRAHQWKDAFLWAAGFKDYGH